LFLLLLSVLATAAMLWFSALPYEKKVGLLFQFLGIWLAVLVGGWLLWTTYRAVQVAYMAALANGEDPGIWPQIITIGTGILLLIAGWQLWQKRSGKEAPAPFSSTSSQPSACSSAHGCSSEKYRCWSPQAIKTFGRG